MTQCATAALLFGAGDVIAQQAVDRKGLDHDVRPFSMEWCLGKAH